MQSIVENSQNTHAYTTCKRTKETACDDMLPHGLSVALGCHALDQAREEINHLWLSHLKGNLGRDVSIKHISAHKSDHGCLMHVGKIDIMHMRYSTQVKPYLSGFLNGL